MARVQRKKSLDQDTPILQVCAELDTARNLGKKLAQSVPLLDADQLLLIEEHLSAIVQKWLHAQRREGVEDLSVRDFSVLMKFLLDIAERRLSFGVQSSDAPLQPDQLAAIQQTLIGVEE